MNIDRLKDPRAVEQLASRLGARHIGHELVLTDNRLSFPSADFDGRDSFRTHPVKMAGASIVFCISGTMSYRVNLSEHTFGAGEVLVILPGSIMQITGVDEAARFANISFATDYYDAVAGVGREMRSSPVVSMPEAEFREFTEIYGRLHSHLSDPGNSAAKEIAKGYMHVIGTLVFKNWRLQAKATSLPANAPKSRPAQLYAEFLAMVQDEYRTHRSVKYYADRLFVTPKYLSRIIKSQSGRNAADFIDELVIFESKALLADARFSVSQVAEMMEFPNPSFFSRYFRLHTGLSPSDYRRDR